LAWPVVILTGLAACLSDDTTSQVTAVTGSDSEKAATAAIVLPPGDIIDTQPDSGWTEGRFSVNHNGAAEYHLPLWVPDGRGGLTPELALHYNSQGGNGLVGVGWSLSAGLSSISPCPLTLARDGRAENAGFGRADSAYCLDGQRLRPVSGGGDGEQDYRTERDTISRIRAYHTAGSGNPPARFEVRTKDGRILTYDAVLPAYQLTGQNPEDPSFTRSAAKVTVSWALRTIEDRNGNAITIQYETIEREDNQWSVEMFPRFITYGPDRSIEFVYDEDRPDTISLFHAGRSTLEGGDGGVHTDVSRLLTSIKVSAGDELLRTYTLTFDQSLSTDRSLLSSVTECDGASEPVCLRPLQFVWSGGFNNSFEEIDTDVTDAAIAAWDGRYYMPGDIDGDGKDDLLYRNETNDWKMRFSNGNGFGPAQDAGIPKVSDDHDTKARAIDFDRDGRMDVMVEIPDSSDRTVFRLYRSTGGGFEEVFTDPARFAWNVNGDFEGGLWNGFFADIDGNGLPDYLGAVLDWRPDEEPSIRMRWRYRLNSGSGLEPFQEGPITAGPIAEFGEDVPFDYQIRAMASDGRRARLVKWAGGDDSKYTALGLFETMAESEQALNLPFLTGDENVDRRNLHFADVNGDGLEDAVYPCTGMKVQLSSGLGFSHVIEGPDEYEPCDPLGSDANLRIRVVDFTGDGNDDILLIHPGFPESSADFAQGIQIYTWTGRGFRRRATNIGVRPIMDAGGEPIGAIQPLDFNGDGLMDIAKVVRTGPQVTTSFLKLYKRLGWVPQGPNTTQVPDKLVRVKVAGLGDRVEVDYTTLADSAIHTPATASCAYPLTCPRRGGSVVWMERRANGMVHPDFPWHTVTHHYAAARVDLRGHGWLGFAQHDVRDTGRVDAVTSTSLDNNEVRTFPVGGGVMAYVYPFAGQPDNVVSTVVSGTRDGAPVTRESMADGELRFIPGAIEGTWRLRLASRTVRDRERVGEGDWVSLRLRTTTFDDYDEFENARAVATAVPGADQIDSFTYENDTASWLIGLRKTHVATSCTRPDGSCQTRTVGFDYDASGNLEERVIEPDLPADTALHLRTTVRYGNFGNITSVTHTDASDEARTTSFTYDPLELYPASSTNALGHTASVTVHSGLGVALDSRDPNGVVPATMKYDRFGRLREVNHADGYFERYSSDGPLIGRTTVPDGNGGTVVRDQIQTDALGRPIRSILFDEHQSTVVTSYDHLGRVVRISRPHPGLSPPIHFTAYTYDDLDRLLTTTAPDGVTTRNEYIGLETHSYDGENVHSYVVERRDGRIGSRFEDDPDSDNWLETKFDYGPFGLLRGTTAADGTTQSMVYDLRGRRIQHMDPSTGTTTALYNAFGDLRQEINGEGEMTDVQIRDLLGRVWRISSPDGLTTFEWDKPGGLGKLDVATQLDHASGHYVITRFTYDDIGRNSKASWEIDNGHLFEVNVGFDTIGRLGSITYPRLPFEPESLSPPRFKVNYQYSPVGYLRGVTDAATGMPYWTADAREPDGQIEQETYGNGVVGMREYEPQTGMLLSLTADGPGARLDELIYDYDDNRNVRLRDDLVGTDPRSQTYTYDSLGRLDTWTHARLDDSDTVTTDFSYDSIGNLLGESVTGRTGRNVVYRYAENGAPRHVLTSRNGQPYTHDAAGRRTAGAALSSITYNRRNLPLVIQRSSGISADLAYDAAGTRVYKRTNAYTRFSIGGLFERTIRDDIQNVHFVMAEGREVAEVTMTQAEPEGPITGTATRYIHPDGQGSAVLVTNEAGARVADVFYDPFGRRTDDKYDPLGGSAPVRPGYTGHRPDEEFGLIDMRGRVYDPDTRRFLTPDPFVQAPLFSQSHNRYSYVWNNPATLIDPSGFAVWDDIIDWISKNADPTSSGGGLASTVTDLTLRSICMGCDGLGVATQYVNRIARNLGWSATDNVSTRTPSSDDNNLTDGISTLGSRGGPAIPISAGQDSWWPVALGVPGAELTSDAEPFVMPEWISDLQRELAGLGRYAAWSHGPSAPGAWSAAVDSTTAGALTVDRLAGYAPFGGTAYYAATGQWGNAVVSGLTDLAFLGGAKLAARGGGDVVYHYTTTKNAAGIQRTGLWSQSSATDVGSLSAREAVERLGVKTPPDVVVEIRNGGQFVPNKPAIVQPHPLGPGGGLDLTNPARVQPDCVVCVRPVRKP
jgi:RHS repeat-associated protein